MNVPGLDTSLVLPYTTSELDLLDFDEGFLLDRHGHLRFIHRLWLVTLQINRPLGTRVNHCSVVEIDQVSLEWRTSDSRSSGRRRGSQACVRRRGEARRQEASPQSCFYLTFPPQTSNSNSSRRMAPFPPGLVSNLACAHA